MTYCYIIVLTFTDRKLLLQECRLCNKNNIQIFTTTDEIWKQYFISLLSYYIDRVCLLCCVQTVKSFPVLEVYSLIFLQVWHIYSITSIICTTLNSLFLFLVGHFVSWIYKPYPFFLTIMKIHLETHSINLLLTDLPYNLLFMFSSVIFSQRYILCSQIYC